MDPTSSGLSEHLPPASSRTIAEENWRSRWFRFCVFLRLYMESAVFSEDFVVDGCFGWLRLVLVLIEDLMSVLIEDLMSVLIEDVMSVLIDDLMSVLIEDLRSVLIDDLMSVLIEDLMSVLIEDLMSVLIDDLMSVLIEDLRSFGIALDKKSSNAGFQILVVLLLTSPFSSPITSTNQSINYNLYKIGR